MPVPIPVQAGTGLALTTGTGTVSVTGALAGNLLLLDIVERGLTGDFSGPSNGVNINRLDGSSGFLTGYISNHGIGSPSTSQRFVYAGRAAANGTCSVDLTVGASGNDLFARIYEISGASTGTTTGTVFEASAVEANTTTTIVDSSVTTLGADRLAVQFVALESNQALGDFTGETGGDWTEAFAEFASSTGVTATLQIQTANMTAAGTIDGGTISITSAGWGVSGFAIIGAPASAPSVLRVVSSGLRW